MKSCLPLPSSQTFLARARRPWIIEQHRDSSLLDVPKLRHLRRCLPRPGSCWILRFWDRRGDNGKFFCTGHVDRWDFAQICSPNVLELVGHCNASRRTPYQCLLLPAQTHFPLMNSPVLPDFSLTLVMFLAMTVRRFQRTHPWSGTCYSLDASKGIGIGVTDLALVDRQLVVDAVRTAVVGSSRTGVRDASPDREDRSSDVCHVSHSLKKSDDDSILHTHHPCRTTPGY